MVKEMVQVDVGWSGLVMEQVFAEMANGVVGLRVKLEKMTGPLPVLVRVMVQGWEGEPMSPLGTAQDVAE